MKKIIYSILTACTLAWTTSCGDFDINGDLDGMWHLRTVETLADNSVENVKEQCVYYSIQQNLISVKRLYKDNQPDAPKHKQHIGRFIHKGDSLILHDFRVFQNEDIVATYEDLAPFYLVGTTSRYAIKKLNADEMVLRTKLREFTFKKF